MSDMIKVTGSYGGLIAALDAAAFADGDVLKAYPATTEFGLVLGAQVRKEDAKGVGRTVGHIVCEPDTFAKAELKLSDGWMSAVAIGRVVAAALRS